MSIDLQEGCLNCKFSRSAANPASKEIMFFCAKRGPTGLMAAMQGGMQLFAIMPPLPPTMWCGEWEKGVIQPPADKPSLSSSPKSNLISIK